MKIGIYTPYLDSFGGGERYVLTIAEILSSEHDVDLLLDQHQLSLDPSNLKIKLADHLNLDLSKVNLVKAPLGKGESFLRRLFFLKKYDLLFYLTDGSVFYSTAKKNLIHFQVPFKNETVKNPWGKFKLSSWDLGVCNSKFTEKIINEQWPIKTYVIYPPVAVEKIKPLKKKKQILTVGRFNSFLKPKKHELMIEAFQALVNEGSVKGWKFVLAGSVEGDTNYIEELKRMAEQLPVEFYPNCPFSKLLELYGESSVYWHAMGYGEEDPAKMEHFGITTVEAMAGGCVPVVINKGGQVEVIEDKKNGFLWNDLEGMKKITLKLIDNPKAMQDISQEAVLRSKIFSKENFQKEIIDLVANI